MRAQLVEALAHALLHDVLEVDDAEDAAAVGDDERRAAAAWRCRRRSASSSGGTVPPCSSTQRRTESAAPLRIDAAVDVDAAHAGLGGERDELGAGQVARRRGRSCSSASVTIERPSGVSSARLREQRGVGQLVLVDAAAPGGTRRPGGCRR